MADENRTGLVIGTVAVIAGLGALLWWASRKKVPPPLPPTEFPEPDPTPTPVPPLGVPVVRLFVLVPSDSPLPSGGLNAVATRWWMGLNWLRDCVGVVVAAERDPILLRMPFTFAEIRRAAEEEIPDNVPGLVFNWMQRETAFPPRGPEVYARDETWILIVRGAGGFAGALPREGSTEDVNWAVLGDAVLSSFLSAYELEPNICPDVVFPYMAREDRLYFCTPDAQTGALVHELCHAAFGAPDLAEVCIMGPWWDWPNVPVGEETEACIFGCPYVLP